jgi:hypothetical protein
MAASAASSAPVSEFAAVVRRRSWDWLTALQRRLNVDRLQILNEQGSPLVPEAGPAWAETLRESDMAAAIGRALHSKMPESVRLGDVQLTCVGLSAGHARGAMVLSRSVSEPTATKSRTELELIGTWLRPAVEAHLGSTQSDSNEQVPSVSSLFKVLSTAPGGASESTLVSLYANALAIWHDIDLRAYVEDVEGNFRLETALPGMFSSEIPTTLNGSEIAVGPELARLSTHELDLLRFRSSQEVIGARIGSPGVGTAWLLIHSGEVEAAGIGRLTLYTDVLRQALQNVAASALLGIERTVWRELVTATDQMTAAAETALHELRAAVRGNAAALSITMAGSGRLVQVGEIRLLDQAGTTRSGRLETVVNMDDGGILQLVVEEPRRQFFTSRDQQVVETAGRLVASWVGGVLRRAPTAFERRALNRSFADVLEQAASQSTAQGVYVSVVVIRPPDGHQDLARRLAAPLRANLRAGEPVGLLGSDEVGVLLYDCTADAARTVMGRLRRVLEPQAGDLLGAATVGIADCAPGGAASQLVRTARQNATRS